MNEIDRILTQAVEDDKTPSVQYAIFKKDRIIHRFQSGFSDIKNKQKTTEHTSFHAYSVTKTFTALSVLQLAQQKTVNIDQPVKGCLPGFPYSQEITIRQLMTHSAGIPNPVPLSWIHLAKDHNTFDRDDFFQQVFLKNNKTKSKPNEKYRYSNLGYVLLGQLIEKISGLKFDDYVRKNIIQRLDIKPTELDFTITNSLHHARGYHKKNSFSNVVLGFFIDKAKYMDAAEGKWVPFKDNYVNGAAYGGLIGTVNAFVVYIQELLKPDCKLLTDEYKKMLFIENRLNSNTTTGMCLSWFTGELNGKKYFTHAGGGGGYYCEIRIYPDIGTGSIIMFNRTGMTDERYLSKLDSYFINV